MNLRSSKGINMITLSVAVLILVIITSILVFSSKDSIKIRDVRDLYNDIELLNNKVGTYYAQHGDIPKSAKYENLAFLNKASYEQINPNNGDDYYVIDLEAMEGITLNYGRDYDKVSKGQVISSGYEDIYIINEQSHTIYYPRGIDMQGELFFTYPEKWAGVELVDIASIKIVNIVEQPKNVNTRVGVNEDIVFKVIAEGQANLSYQWYWAEDTTSRGTQISGATSNQYIIRASDISVNLNNRYYYCIITEIIDGETITKETDRAKLTVAEREHATNPTLTAYEGPYDGNAHTIEVEPSTGESLGGTIEYSTDRLNWSTQKPTRTECGVTTVYVRVRGDSSHQNSETISSTITITRGESTTLALSMANYIYGGTKSEPQLSGNEENGVVTYYYNTTNSTEGGTNWNTVTSSTSLPAGTYYIYAVVGQTANYDETKTDAIEFIIEKATNLNITVSMTGYTYGGERSNPSVSGNAENGEVTYYYNTTNATAGGTNWNTVTSSTSLPVGTYYMYATVGQTANYNEATTTAVEFTIARGENTNVTVNITGYTYGGEKPNPTVSGNDENGEVTYYYNTTNSTTGGIAWNTVTSSTSLPAGTYYMYATIGQTANYNGGTTAPVELTIAKATPSVTVAPTSGAVNYNRSNTFTATPNSTPAINGTWSVTSSTPANVEITKINNSTDLSNPIATNNTASEIEYQGLVATATPVTITVLFTPSDTVNYNTQETTYTVNTVNKIQAIAPVIGDTTATYDGQPHTIETTSQGSGGTIQYRASTDGGETYGEWQSVAPTITNYSDATFGTLYVQAQVAGDSNHTDSEVVTATAHISETAMTISGATDYTGTYDGQTHGIEISVSTPSSGAVVYYSKTAALTENNYDTAGSTTPITATNVAESTTVYWYIKSNNANYSDLSGSNDITINAKDIEAEDITTTISQNSYTYDGTAKTPTTTVIETPVVGTSVSELQEGDEVVYTDQNGNEIPCIVLYASKDSSGNNTSYYENNGVQIITKDLAKDSNGNDITIELGNGTGNSSTDPSHFATAKASYNTAIATLNNAARGYLNTDLATNARCVGSIPSETPVTSETNTGTYTNEYEYFSEYNDQFKPSSTNDEESTNEDWLKIKTLNCHDISKNYWLASRYVWGDTSRTDFNMHYAIKGINGGCSYYSAYVSRVRSYDSPYSFSSSFGIRPVFILKSDIYYVEENGTKRLVKNRGLTENIDYTLSYNNSTTNTDNRTTAGTITITVTGIGNYTGTTTKTYTINKADVTLTNIPTGLQYIGKEMSKSFTATAGTAGDWAVSSGDSTKISITGGASVSDSTTDEVEYTGVLADANETLITVAFTPTDQTNYNIPQSQTFTAKATECTADPTELTLYVGGETATVTLGGTNHGDFTIANIAQNSNFAQSYEDDYITATVTDSTLTVNPIARTENPINLTVKESNGSHTISINIVVKFVVHVSLTSTGATSAGTTSVDAAYGYDLPNISIPNKVGYTFVGYYTENAKDMVTNINTLTDDGGLFIRRINFPGTDNGWQMTSADSGAHIQGKIQLKDSSITNTPRLEFNDVSINPSRVEHTGDIWTFYVDFDVSEFMVSTREHNFDTKWRFIDIIGASSSTSIIVNYLIKDGKQYYNNIGNGVNISDFTVDTTLYAKWEANAYIVTLNNQNATSSGTTNVFASYNNMLPNISVPGKTGKTFGGYYSTTNASDMTTNISILNGNTGRIDFKGTNNGWQMTSADAGTHIQGKIIVENSNSTNAPSLEFNDVSINTYKVEHSNDTWILYVDFDITEYMVSARQYGYDVNHRFIDVTGITSSMQVTAEYIVKGGKKYYNSSGVGVFPYDTTSNTTLYAKWN